MWNNEIDATALNTEKMRSGKCAVKLLHEMVKKIVLLQLTSRQSSICVYVCVCVQCIHYFMREREIGENCMQSITILMWLLDSVFIHYHRFRLSFYPVTGGRTRSIVLAFWLLWCTCTLQNLLRPTEKLLL